MRVVVVTELRGDIESTAPDLATLLGLSAYDVRARLTGPLPRVVLQTGDEALARRVLQGLEARGHRAVDRDAAALLSSTPMVRLHRFSIEAGGLWANDRAGDFLAWGDLGAVILALVRGQVSRTTEEVEVEFRGARHPLTVKHDVTRTDHALTHAAFLFPHAKAPSRAVWLLEEVTAQYLALGDRMQPTRRANFHATVSRIRALAPRAVVDDRFVTHPLTSPGVTRVRGAESPPQPGGGVPLEANVRVLAEWLLRDRGGPYRG